MDTIKDDLPPLSAKAQKDADELLADNYPPLAGDDLKKAWREVTEDPEPPMKMLAVMSLKILYDIWECLGKEESN